ncbi:hypothetical protein D9758_010363 [Tetrapyrgos nigripes]|uniref:F-box domain-containing protein n=1 Tax=Tetrapyrgos nigripes TaxID=182062 RepID=A0A8H5FVZ8_9AGAR|nr:hypothetical protein D9758_010363 [Tetrapyrgos nigripes]
MQENHGILSPKNAKTTQLCFKCRNKTVPQTALSETVAKYLAAADSLVGSNDPPLGNDLDAMRASLTDAEIRIQEIERQLKILEEQKEILEKEKGSLSNYTTVQKTVLNPIRRAPVEVLADIFTICVKNATSDAYENALKIQSVRWVLSHVCTRWRAISLTTASLWTNIELELNENNAAFSPRAFLLGLHIQRSKHLPLEIGLYSYIPQVPQSHYLLTMLLPTASRWETLHTDMKPECLQGCLAPMGPFISSIRHFYTYHGVAVNPNPVQGTTTTAQANGNANDQSDPVVCDAFHQSSLLHDIILREDICRFKFSAERIHTLVLINTFYAISDVLSALRSMVQLQEFTLSRHALFLGQDDEETYYPPLHLPDLRVLTLADDKFLQLGDGDEDQDLVVSRFLDVLVLPSLDAIDDEHTNSADTQNFVAFLSLFERSKCHLKSFSTSTTISEDGFICLVRDNPSLVSLDLRGMDEMRNQPITELVYRPDQAGSDWQCLLPALESLELHGNMSFDATVFVDMVESRLKGYREGAQLARITEVTLKWSGDSPDDEAAFDRFNDAFFVGFRFTAKE